MVTLHRLICLSSALAMILSSGCFSVDAGRLHPSWPKPVAATSLQEFQGVYRNHSLDTTTGQPSEQGNQLFNYLIGHAHSHGELGDKVDLRVATDKSSLRVVLFDMEGHEIDSATLQCKTAFTFAGGKVTLHGPSSGLRDLNSNWGVGVKSTHYALRLTTNGGLRGDMDERNVALLMDVIPTAGTTSQFMFWPRFTE